MATVIWPNTARPQLTLVLRQARTFVLVGDHNQLPPLVVIAEAEREGLGHSLFRTLSEAHPQVSPGFLVERTVGQNSSTVAQCKAGEWGSPVATKADVD